MQTMELVDIEDVYLYEENDVRMNPRDVSSKECQKYIEQLGEQFKFNKLNPGQPRIRPILYRDGGIYWIVDGECRYWAMKKIGTKKFYADVFDDIADAETARQEAAKAMVETDAKRTLTTEEMSRGVQTMLSLAIPDEEVAAAAHMDKTAVRKTRRAIKAVGQDAYYMTLDRLMAIAEFDGTVDGDAEAAHELATCNDKEWKNIYESKLRDRKIAMSAAKARKVCAFFGAHEYEEAPEDTAYVAQFFLGDLDLNKVRETVQSTPDALFGISGYWLEIRRPRTLSDTEKEAEIEDKKRQDDQTSELWTYENAARDAWIAEHANNPKSMRATAAICADLALGLAQSFIERTDCDVDFTPTPALTLIGWSSSWVPNAFLANTFINGRVPGYLDSYLEQASTYIELTDAMEQDGYEPTEIGRTFLEQLRKWEEKHRG